MLAGSSGRHLGVGGKFREGGGLFPLKRYPRALSRARSPSVPCL